MEIVGLQIAIVLTSFACFVFGGRLFRKGIATIRSNKIDGQDGRGLAHEFGTHAIGLGTFVFLFGGGLLYLLTMF